MILIADDSKFMRNWLKKILLQNGHTNIVEASNGEVAFNLYRLLKPDIVFLDITMPVMDGLTALNKIMEINPQANVVMCSSMGTNANVTAALRGGAKDFVVKPFFNDLINIIDSIQEVETISR